MPLPPHSVDLDELRRLRLAGQSVEKIAAYFHTTKPRIRQLLVDEGLPVRTRARDLPVDAIVGLYADGESPPSIGRYYGCSAFTIKKILVEAGVQLRDASAARRAEYAGLSPDQRRARAAAAHVAARGRIKTEAELERQALAKQAAGLFDSPHEERLARLLAARGVRALPQRAVGPFNVDLAVGTIAVEVCASGRFAYGDMRERYMRKFRRLIDDQWLVVVVWATWSGNSQREIGPGAADHVVTLLEQSSSNPPVGREYRMIGSDGELLAVCGRESDHIPFVVPSMAARGIYHVNERA